MKIYYSLTINCNREMEDGILKNVNEQYLLDAVSYTDAETIAYAFAEQNISREFQITKVVKTNISEIVNKEDCDPFFKCKVTYSTVDGDNGKETKVNTYIVVNADNARQAYDRVEEHLHSMLVPYEIPSIVQTNILEVVDGEQYSGIEGGLTKIHESLEEV